MTRALENPIFKTVQRHKKGSLLRCPLTPYGSVRRRSAALRRLPYVAALRRRLPALPY